MFEGAVGAGIAGAIDLAGGYLGYKGQKEANAQNLAIAREQMAFQERMSNTAYQRAAKDMEKAGLNRILALGSPASSPGGSALAMENVHKQTPQAFSAASAKVRMHEELKLLREQQENVQSSTLLNNANARKAAAEASQAEVMKLFFDALGPTAKNFGDWLKGQLSNSGKAVPGVMDKARGVVTDVLESTANSAKGVKDDLENLKPLDLVPEGVKKKLREMKDSNYYRVRDLYRKHVEPLEN